MLSVSKILEHIPSDGSIEIKKLEKILKLSKKIERSRLEIGLSALLKLGVIQKNSVGDLIPGQLDQIISGQIRCSSKGYSFVVRDDGDDDIYVREQYLNHSWHGDKVLVKIVREGIRRRSPEGSVLCILERSNNNLLASINEEDSNLLAIPLDERILAKVELSNSNKDFSSKKDYIYQIQINQYPIGQYNAKGEITSSLSLNNGYKGDIDIVKAKNNIYASTAVPKIQLKEPPSKNRIDLTHQNSLLFKSWQSDDAPNLMAIYAEPFEGGAKLWLHIPTVSERINPGGKIDKWLIEQPQSLCLGDNWINLLPPNLILESKFEPDKENSSITLELNIDKKGEVQTWEFYLSKIKPKVHISNEHLGLIVNRKPKSRTIPTKLKPIKDHIVQIETIIFVAKLLNENLLNKGYVELDSGVPELDKIHDHYPQNPGNSFCSWKPVFEAAEPNSILNVFTRIANIVWNQHHTSLSLPSIYLTDQLFEPNNYNDVVKSAISLNTKIQLNDSGGITLSELVKSIVNNPNQKIIEKSLRNTLPIKLYKIYDPSLVDQENHKELHPNNIYETPWASPTISYADIINQHILVFLLNECKSKEAPRSKIKVSLGQKDVVNQLKWELYSSNQLNYLLDFLTPSITKKLNDSAKKSLNFTSGLISIIEARAIQSNIGNQLKGVITGVQSYGFFVELSPLQSEGLVHVSSLDDDWYEYRSRQNMLIGRKSKRTYQIGDEVDVEVKNVDILKSQIDLEVVTTLNESSIADETQSVSI